MPLARPFSKGLLMVRIHSLFLSFRLEDPSCAFGAALLQGPTHGADSLSFLFFLFRLGGSILRLWRGPSPRAYSWCGFTLFSFHSALRGSILRLWRGPSPRAYSWSGFTLFSFHSASSIHPAPLTRPFSQSQRQLPQKEKSQLSLTLFRDRVSSREADIGHCFFLPPR